MDISLTGIEQAIDGLGYRSDKSPKYRLAHAIRSIYNDADSVESVRNIDNDTLINTVWDLGGDEKAIRSKRKNLNSIKSSVNADLDAAWEDGRNPEGISIGPRNTFIMSDAAKDKLLDSISGSMSLEGGNSLEKVAEALKIVTEYLSDIPEDVEGHQMSNLKSLVEGLSEKLSGGGIGEYELTEKKGDDYTTGDDTGEVSTKTSAPGAVSEAETSLQADVADDSEIIEEAEDGAADVEGDETEIAEIEDDADIEEVVADDSEIIEEAEDGTGDLEGDETEIAEIEDDADIEEVVADDSEIIEEAEDGSGDLEDGETEITEIEDEPDVVDEIEEDDAELEEIDDEDSEGMEGEGEDTDDLEGHAGLEDGDVEVIDVYDEGDVQELSDDDYVEIEEEEGLNEDGEGIEPELEEDADDTGGEGEDEFDVADDLEEADEVTDDLTEAVEDLAMEIEEELDDLAEMDEGIDEAGVVEEAEAEDLDQIEDDADVVEGVEDDDLVELEDKANIEDLEDIDEPLEDEEVIEDDEVVEADTIEDMDEVELLDEDDDVDESDEHLDELDGDEAIGAVEEADTDPLEEEGQDEFVELDEDTDVVEALEEDDLVEVVDEADVSADEDALEEMDAADISGLEEDDAPPLGKPGDDIGLPIDQLSDDEFNFDEFEPDEAQKRLLSEQFDGYLGAMERYYNQYIVVPKGRYKIGVNKEDGDFLTEQILALSDYYMGKYPVTNALFEIFIERTGYKTTAEKMGYGYVYFGRFQKKVDPKTGLSRSIWNPAYTRKKVEGAVWFQPTGPGSTLHQKRNHPVVQISFKDAGAFAAWTGKRLPTEIEWEAAARGQSGNIFPWGNEWRDDVSNIENGAISDTCPVDAYPQGDNDNGLSDLLGNVLEWTADECKPKYPVEKAVKCYIAKGASWVSTDQVHLYDRTRLEADFSSNILGFRCVAD